MKKQQWELIPLSIKYLGMSATEINGVLYFRADEVEHQFSKGVVVYGMKHSLENSSAFTSITRAQGPNDTHVGLLLGYQPIPKEKPVTKKELIKVIQELDRVRNRNIVAHDNTADDLIERIKKTEVIK